MIINRTRVKVCGITRIEDAIGVAQSGCDAIGLVFYEGSPRYIDAACARKIVRALPPFVSVVGLFVDAQAHRVQQVADQVGLQVLQFHGHEPPEYCAQFGLPYLKAIRMSADINLLECASCYNGAQALLLDSYNVGVMGGSGVAFDWRVIPRDMPCPIILAGGIHADNVGAAIAQVAPYAVDVSSGLESEKGIKCMTKVAAFMQKVQDAAI